MKTRHGGRCLYFQYCGAMMPEEERSGVWGHPELHEILSQTHTDTPPPHHRQNKNKERMKKWMITISEADHCSISNGWGGDVAMLSEGDFLLICLLRLLEFCLYFLTRVLTAFTVSLFSHQVAKPSFCRLLPPPDLQLSMWLLETGRRWVRIQCPLPLTDLPYKHFLHFYFLPFIIVINFDFSRQFSV